MISSLGQQVVIPANPNHKTLKLPAGIGKSLRTKVNVNIGTSADFPRLSQELKKVEVSLKYGADAIMDLSTGGNRPKIRRKILASTPIPLGTVPIYQAAIASIDCRGSIVKMTVDDLFAAIEAQAREGVDFMTVHCGLIQKAIDRLKKHKRVADIVSRGGAALPLSEIYPPHQRSPSRHGRLLPQAHNSQSGEGQSRRPQWPSL